MAYDNQVRFRAPDELVGRVEEIAERNDFDESEVYRRLIRLGFEDIDQLGDKALLVAVNDGTKQEPAD